MTLNSGFYYVHKLYSRIIYRLKVMHVYRCVFFLRVSGNGDCDGGGDGNGKYHSIRSEPVSCISINITEMIWNARATDFHSRMTSEFRRGCLLQTNMRFNLEWDTLPYSPMPMPLCRCALYLFVHVFQCANSHRSYYTNYTNILFRSHLTIFPMFFNGWMCLCWWSA